MVDIVVIIVIICAIALYVGKTLYETHGREPRIHA